VALGERVDCWKWLRMMSNGVLCTEHWKLYSVKNELWFKQYEPLAASVVYYGGFLDYGRSMTDLRITSLM
jgi:hypothetical protein